MTSPARAHRLRALAANRVADGAEPPPAHANAYELMLMQLAEHRRRLKQVQSIERKIEAKRTMLPEYMPWVQGVLQADAGGQDDVLMTVMVWLMDTGDLATAIDIAEYAIRHGLVMPDQYERGVTGVIAEEAADLALRAMATGGSAAPELLLRIEAITAGHDMHDEIRAKLHKAIGYALRDIRPRDAVTHLRRALELHDKVGVKKDIERLERHIKNTVGA